MVVIAASLSSQLWGMIALSSMGLAGTVFHQIYAMCCAARCKFQKGRGFLIGEVISPGESVEGL